MRISKITYLSILFIILSQIAFSQETVVGVQLGYGVYSLPDQKAFQSEFLLDGAESVTTFPNGLNFSGSIDFGLNPQSLLGINIAYYYTGGRNHLSDYSGEYILDMWAHAYRFGLMYQYLLPNKTASSFHYYIGANAGLIYSSFKMQESIELYGIVAESNTMSYTILAPFIEPRISATYKLYRQFNLSCSLGYEIDIINESNPQITSQDNDWSMPTDWSGLRTTIGLSYRF